MICGNSTIHLQSYCVPAVLDPSTPGEDANRGHPTTLLTSVELPRWIDHPSVDSQAMLSAFLAYTHRSTEEAREQVKCLYMIVHEHESTFVKDNEVIQPQEISPLPTRPCKARECKRCDTKCGGYQFRWYHRRWKDDYMRLKRDGAWTPYKLEGNDTRK